MEDMLKNIQAQLEDLTEASAAVSTRLDVLELADKQLVPSERHEDGSRKLPLRTPSKEKSLTLTFGDKDCSATNLRVFLDHYDIARSQNVRKRVEGWLDPEFRANELRFQLRGEPALWLAHQYCENWVSNDDEIREKLIERYNGTQCTEQKIIAFEELTQYEMESLAEYMTRCQRRGYKALGDMDVRSTQQRIVWKFLSGIRDREVRNAVVKAKWMKSTKEAKSYGEVLKIAQTAKMTMHLLQFY